MSAEDVDGRGPYGTVYRRLWHRSDFRGLSFDAKAVYLYIKTCPAGGMVGIFQVRPEDIRDDLGLGVRLAERALRELEAEGFIRRERSWVFIVDALASTPGISLSNPKHFTAALKGLASVPDNLANACRNLYSLNTPTPIANPVGNTIPNPNGYPNQVDVDGDGDVTADGERRFDERTAGMVGARQDMSASFMTASSSGVVAARMIATVNRDVLSALTVPTLADVVDSSSSGVAA